MIHLGLSFKTWLLSTTIAYHPKTLIGISLNKAQRKAADEVWHASRKV